MTMLISAMDFGEPVLSAPAFADIFAFVEGRRWVLCFSVT